MGKHVFKANLSVSSLKQLAKNLEDYKTDLETTKIEQLVTKLADVGIKAARSRMTALDNLGNVGYLVELTKEIEPSIDGCTAIMYASDSMSVTKSWLRYNKVVHAEVSPLLMYEFGSGIHAVEGHRGTFPSDTAKKNAAKGVWKWKDLSGQWHTFSGIEPTRPLYNAAEEMRQAVLDVAKEVFG